MTTSQQPHTMSTYDAPPASAEAVMLPPSYAQELLWLMDRAAPGSAAYNVPRTRRILGTLDVAALQRAFDALVARHEILRTTYAFHDDQPVQVVHPPRPVSMRQVDLSTMAPAPRAAEARRLVDEAESAPFDLTRDILIRPLLIRFAPDEHLLHFDSHHIAFDGWSRDVLFRDLSALYAAEARGEAPTLPALPIQYADFAIWQRQHLAGDTLEALLAYWRAELGDADFVLDLPTDYPRPAVPGFEGVTARATVPPSLRDAIRRLGQRYNATTYMTLLAAYMTVLHRYTGQRDVLVGSPIAGRERPETEGLIGYFANTIVQRGRFASDPTFGELLTQVRESALGAYDHQQVPFEKLVLELQGGQQFNRSPLFQAVFTMLGGSDGASEKLGDLALAPFGTSDASTKFDLTFFMAESPDALTLMARGRADLFAAETMERFLAHVQQVLEAAAVDPDEHVSRLAMLTPSESRALESWNETSVDVGEPVSVVDLFARAAARVPNRVAVHSGERWLSYAQVDTRANQLANHLRAMGVGANTPVGIALDRSADIIVAIMGVLKAGAAYVPLLPEVPVARLAQQVTESGAQVVVTVAAYADRFAGVADATCLDRDAGVLDAALASAPDVSVAPESTAYVLYTSGSTGVPKGVAVTHANVVHYTRAISRVLADVPKNATGDGLAALDGWHFAMVSTLGADLGNTCLFPALCSGGTLHVLPNEVATDPARFAAYMGARSIDVMKVTPSHLRALVSGAGSVGEMAVMLPHRWLVLGGEALSWDFASQLSTAIDARARACRLLNHYGPTETTVGCSTFEVTAASAAAAREAGAQTVPIGRPLANTTLHVLDAHGARVPVGVPAELYVAGAGVTAGYVNRPELTTARFVELPGVGRAYRTGDRVRRLPLDGVIEFLGRGDDQVKIRGYRVELGEIEHTLLQHPGVTEAAVIVSGDSAEADARLVAYVVARAASSEYAAAHTGRVEERALREWLAQRLPEYMVPDAVIVLDRMPLTPSGKVDRRALPALHAVTSPADAHVAPRTPTEIAIAGIWSEVLRTDNIGITQNFIALGGHSLLAIRVLGKLSRQFGVRLPLRTLFDAPTVETLAELVDIEVKLAALDTLETESDRGNGPGA